VSRIVHATIIDLRTGRESWRVLMLLSVPAIAAGILAGLNF
jgi:hypothetical protein